MQRVFKSDHRGVLMMAATIKLRVNSGSGVLSAVVSRLQAAGVRVKSHDLEPINEGSAMLTLNAEADDGVDKEDLRSRLSDIEVVQSVEDISSGESAPARRAAEVEVSVELVNRIVASYPKIMPHIQNYEEQIAKDPQRVEKLKQLGVEAGRRFAAALEPGSLESLSDVIDDVVLPGIGSIAEASRSGDTVVVPVSLFSRRVVTSMDLFSDDDQKCDFLCGFIEGLVSSSPGYESVSVTESRCRANGDPACVFTLT